MDLWILQNISRCIEYMNFEIRYVGKPVSGKLGGLFLIFHEIVYFYNSNGLYYIHFYWNFLCFSEAVDDATAQRLTVNVMIIGTIPLRKRIIFISSKLIGKWRTECLKAKGEFLWLNITNDLYNKWSIKAVVTQWHGILLSTRWL